MRETRSRTNRLPLQIIPTQNDQKVLKTESGALKVKSEMGEAVSTPTKVKSKQKTAPSCRGTREPHSDTLLQNEMNDFPHPAHEAQVKTSDASSTAKSDTSRKRKKSPSQSPEKWPAKMDKLDSSSSDSDEELDYEELRKRNLQDNEEFFSSLGIAKAKEQLQMSFKKPSKPYQKKEPKERKVFLRRQSLRIRRIDPEGQLLPPVPEPVVHLENEHPQVPAGPLQMSDALDVERKGVEENHALILSSVLSTDAETCQYKPHSSDLLSFVSEMNKMQITAKAKLCKDRLFSVAVHPSVIKVLAMAGDKWGRLGFWDIDSKDQETVTVYRPHSRPIGHIYVPPSDPHKVYTCSYDSTLRCGHFDQGVFEEVFTVPLEEDDLFRNFDFLTPSTLLLARFQGDVSVIDVRTPSGKAEQSYNVCDKYLRTVNVHPLNNNFFITAGTNMMVDVWDIRKLKARGNKPLHSLRHGRSVSSACFSPLTGQHILSCSADDTLNIYSCSPGCGEVKRAKTMNHNNKTGRWLTPFRSVWHPAREDVFFVGSMKTPRRMEAFGVDGRLLHEFQGETLSSVCSVVQFHPSRPILVGGNSSGYVFPFVF